MKSNLTYYPHRTDAHRHPKFKLLRTLFADPSEGWAAEARFWALNNIIAESDNCTLDLSLKRNQATVAEELGMNLSEFQNFISILKSDDVELITEISPGMFTTKKLQTALEITSGKRLKAQDRKKIKSSGELLQSSGELSESSGELYYKVKESKVNKNKVNESKVNEKENVLLFTFDYFFPLTFDFTFSELTKVKISDLLQNICNVDLSLSETSRIFNILSAEPQITWQQKTKLLFELCHKFNALPTSKKNLPYFCAKLKGEISDFAIKQREKENILSKKQEIIETQNFITADDSGIRDIINSLQKVSQI